MVEFCPFNVASALWRGELGVCTAFFQGGRGSRGTIGGNMGVPGTCLENLKNLQVKGGGVRTPLPPPPPWARPWYRLWTSESDVCRRTILTSKVDPRTVRTKYLSWPYTHNIGIQTTQKELSKMFMMISI